MKQGFQSLTQLAAELEEVGGRIVTLSSDDWFRVANADPVKVAA